MKFRDPETGEIFENIYMAYGCFCGKYKHCIGECPLAFTKSCSDFIRENPREAARLMGYKVIDDTPTAADDTPTVSGDTPTKEDDMNKEDKPRLAEVLGVEVGEKFRVLRSGIEFECVIGQSGMPTMNMWEVLYAINHPESIIRAPRLTEPEIAVMRMMGAKWVSRNINSGVDCAVNCAAVYLWKEKPSSSIGLYFADGGPIATVNDPDLFPSVKPGNLIGLEEVER